MHLHGPIRDDEPEPLEPDAKTEEAVHEMLALLPQDVVADLNAKRIQLGEEGFLEAVAQHIVGSGKIQMSDNPKALLDQLQSVQKRLRALVRATDPEANASGAIRSAPRAGRNDACPCGSGKKYKKCCMKKGSN